MGHGLSCSRDTDEYDLFRAAQLGDIHALSALLAADPALARRATVYDRFTALHIAAANGRLQVLSMLLDRDGDVDVLSRKKQTPLMVAAMRGNTECVVRLLRGGANVLTFDSPRARTCLHHAAYYGHAECLQAILGAAAQAQGPRGRLLGRASCVRLLLDKGAIVSAPTAVYGFPGSTALHLAARAGSMECIRELLAWGADRLQRDSAGRIAYAVAMRRGHRACAALLNPAAAEPIVWPSPLKFIGELEADAKALLEAALMEANREREKRILHGSDINIKGGDEEEESEDEEEACNICFEQACSMEVKECGHQMCAACTLAICCHSKPNPKTLLLHPPACPFCRTTISRLVVATTNSNKTNSRRRSRSRSSSFKGGLSSAMGSFSRIGRGSGRLVVDGSSVGELADKPDHDFSSVAAAAAICDT
ncbi:hypothetical protein OsJ_04951 [Oryza sativa Japonica Group]|uniref:RING-type E3 ubiquitin transferase n=1 Tax=Oryza sativa subsp. japonica TaxID=39947 RepID=B9EX04_ORYSJ|nr:hypothetical protein OsJ_04951 [Oryza sativa Japonica Group]